MSVLCKVDGKEFKDEKSLHLATLHDPHFVSVASLNPPI